MRDYERGFEDALELFLELIRKEKKVEEVERRVLRALAYLKEYKIEKIREMLGL